MATQTRTWCTWDADQGKVWYEWDDVAHTVTAIAWDNQSNKPQTVTLTPNSTGIPMPSILVPAKGLTQQQAAFYSSVVLTSSDRVVLPTPIAMVAYTTKGGVNTWVPPYSLSCAG